MDRKQKTKNDPYLSVVAVSRNDNHGGRLTYRMQKFVDGFVAQCKKHQVEAELILVEWNPPKERPFLEKALNYPKDLGPCSIRVIQVPPEIHDQYDHAKSLPLFQMIGKNVGIRRARGQFILATNIDILFSDALFKFFKSKKLKRGYIYRCDRLDVPAVLPETDNFEAVLKFCKKNYFLINRCGCSIKRRNLRFMLPLLGPLVPFIKFIFKNPELIKMMQKRWHLALKKKKHFTVKKGVLLIGDMVRICLTNFLQVFNFDFILLKRFKLSSYTVKKRLYTIHSNACGDFTLLAKEDWELLRGYVEWPIYSFHIDSILMYQGVLGPLKQKNFGSLRPIYHIEHQIGSGYTPEGENHLFDRLDKAGIPYLSDKDLFDIAVKAYNEGTIKKQILQLQEEDWGLIHHSLPEYTIQPC